MAVFWCCCCFSCCVSYFCVSCFSCCIVVAIIFMREFGLFAGRRASCWGWPELSFRGLRVRSLTGLCRNWFWGAVMESMHIKSSPPKQILLYFVPPLSGSYLGEEESAFCEPPSKHLWFENGLILHCPPFPRARNHSVVEDPQKWMPGELQCCLMTVEAHHVWSTWEVNISISPIPTHDKLPIGLGLRYEPLYLSSSALAVLGFPVLNRLPNSLQTLRNTTK